MCTHCKDLLKTVSLAPSPTPGEHRGRGPHPPPARDAAAKKHEEARVSLTAPVDEEGSPDDTSALAGAPWLGLPERLPREAAGLRADVLGEREGHAGEKGTACVKRCGREEREGRPSWR